MSELTAAPVSSAEIEQLQRDLAVSRAMAENSPINIMMANTDLVITYINPASRRTLQSIAHLLPCKVEEIVGKSVDLFHKNPAHPRQVLTNPKNLPHRAVIQVGNEKLDLLASPMFDAAGSYLGPMVTWDVVTKKLELEAKVADATAQLDAISRTQAVIEFQLDGTIVTANENFLRTLGYSLAEIQGQHHGLFVEESFRQSREYRDFWENLRSGKFQAGEFRRVGKGGKEVWIRASYNPVLNANGVPYKVVKYALDITADVQAREAAALRERETAERDRRDQELLSRKSQELLAVVTATANGDLTREVTVTGDDTIGQLGGGVRRMIGDLRGVISQVVEGAAQFAESARIIAESSQQLANGSQSQSASVEEMSASVEELTRSIESVKNNASDANRVATDTSKMATEGGQAVQKSIEAMDLIKSSSEQISEIIQVISEIASQTNLLALNAAIEAARAGEHGLGFAVVADEVRKLAERSSEAAKQISKLIKESTQRVADGAKLSGQTGKALERIIAGVDATSKKISEIATATVEQAHNANEVANAIQRIAHVTEQSAASSEEMASSSEELGAQASSLRELVRKFKV